MTPHSNSGMSSSIFLQRIFDLICTKWLATKRLHEAFPAVELKWGTSNIQLSLIQGQESSGKCLWQRCEQVWCAGENNAPQSRESYNSLKSVCCTTQHPAKLFLPPSSIKRFRLTLAHLNVTYLLRCVSKCCPTFTFCYCFLNDTWQWASCVPLTALPGAY